MKIGILSMQRIVNYGSFLQSYGLKKTLEKMGHQVEFVDFTIEKPLLNNKLDKKKYRKEIFRNKLVETISKYPSLIQLLPEEKKEIFENRWRYNNEFLPMLGVGTEKNYNAKVDALIIGSDEVFNLFQKSGRVGYSLELYGKNNNAKILMSYAASFGNTTLEKIKSFNKEKEIAELLKEFNSISVRDSNSGEIVKRLTNRKPVYSFDPVLIHDFKDEMPEVNIDKGYIVVYAYRNRLSSSEKEDIIKFARKNNKRIVGLGGYQDFVDEYINASPFELLSYVKNADYVITDTFHGTIFSIITHRKFVSFIRNSKNGKYGNQEKMEDLLRRFNLLNRAIYSSKEIDDKLLEEIDYVEVEHIRGKGIEDTVNYLKESLKMK